MYLAMVANLHRDDKKKPQPFSEEEFELCKSLKPKPSPHEKARRLKEKLAAAWGTGKRKGRGAENGEHQQP